MTNMPALAEGRRKKWALASLFFSGFYFTPYVLFFGSYSAEQLIKGTLVYVAFVAAYLTGVYALAQKVFWPLLAMVFIAFFGAQLNPAALIFFGFATFIIGYHYAIGRAITALLGVLACQSLASYLYITSDNFYVWPTFLTTVGLMIFGVFERKEQLHRQQQERATQRLEQITTIAERERIGRDLHDLAGHALASIAVKAELATKLLDNGASQAARNEINQLADLSRQLLSDIRKAVSDIKYRPIEHEVTKNCQLLQEKGIDVRTDLHLDALHKPQEVQVVFILKELVTNIIKHSDATVVTVGLRVDAAQIQMEVCDNGKIDSVYYGHGLNGIKQRVDQFNGTLDVTTDNGFSVKVCMERR